MKETSESKVKQWYNEKYQKNAEKTMRPESAYPIFLDHLKIKKGHLLDIACGTGYLLKAASERGLKVSGSDLSDKAIEVAKKIIPSADLRVAAAEKLPFSNNTFNYVSCLGSIEHFLNPERALEEMIRVSTKEAKFCFVVPNQHYFFDILSGNHGTEQQEIQETLRTRKEWNKLFIENGFEIIETKQDFWIRNSLYNYKSKNLLDQIKITAKKLIWKLLPISLGYQFIYILRKKT